MDLSNLFKAHLQAKGSSVPTVKNYVADVRKFIRWYEATHNTPFSPSLITAEIMAAYKKSLAPSTSVERYLSSLRKFFVFLKEQKSISSSPFEIENLKLEIDLDPLYIRAFKNSLHEEKAGPLTVKNYILDVNQFATWAKTVTTQIDHYKVAKDDDVLHHLSTDLIEEYKSRLLLDMQLSPVSVNRKLSSIRRYFAFLLKQEIIRTAPFVLNTNLKEADGEKKGGTTEAWNSTDNQEAPSGVANIEILNQVQDDTNGKAPARPAELERSGDTFDTLDTPDTSRAYSPFPPLRLLQKLGSLINLVFDLLIIVPLVKILENGQVILWKLSGKKLFIGHQSAPDFAPYIPGFAKRAIGRLPVKALAETLVKGELASADRQSRKGSLSHFIKTGNWGIQNVSKAFYAPLSISVKELPMHKQIIHHLKHTRPTWYKKYHSLAISHYIHFAILMIFITGLGAGMYTVLFTDASKNKTLAVAPTAPPRILSFQGRLTDNSDNPITATKNVRFSIYDDISATGSGNLLWQEVQGVTPDTDGIFSVLMGNTVTSCVNPLTPATGQCLIPSTLFADNATLYLGITIENDTELGPRQQIATVAYAANSETLQGLPPSTAGGAGTSNVVLALDSSGNLTIGGSATPTFQASGGQFTLSGTVLNLTTTAGTNSNIQFTPDGLGKIDVQKAFVNSTNNSPLLSAAGSVSVDDLFSVNATSSGQSAFTLNQDGAGPLISASTSGIAKFTVGNTGTGYFAGNLGIGTTTPGNQIEVGGGAQTQSQVSYQGTYINPNSGNVHMSLENNAGVEGGYMITGSTVYTGSWSNHPLTFRTANADRMTLSTTGNLGIGTTTPTNFKLEVAGSIGPTLDATYDLGSATKRWNNLYAANIIGGTSGTQGFWQLNNGAISPANSTNDLLLGATATTSAKFAFINNIGSGTPTASISANSGNNALYLNGLGNIATTNKQTLTLGSSSTGDVNLRGNTIDIQSAGGTSLHTFRSDGKALLGLTEGVGIGGAPSGNFFGVYKTLTVGTAPGSNTLSISTAGQIQSNNPANDPGMYFAGDGNSAHNTKLAIAVRNSANTDTITLRRDGQLYAAGNVGIGTTTIPSLLTVSGATTGNSLVTFNQTTSGADILTGSASGTTRFVFNTNGNLGIGSTLPAYTLDINAGSGIVGQFSGRVIGGSAVNSNEFVTLAQLTGGVGQYWQLNSGALAPFNTTADVLVGGTATASALTKFSGTAGGNSFINTGNFGIGTTTPGAKLDLVSTGTTTNGLNLTANSLTTGYGAYLSSTSTALTTGGLLNLDWSPSSATVATGDLLSLNIGSNGTIGNIFNVKDNGSSVFSISQSNVTANVPVSFTSPGDVSISYDLNFTNPTASYINSVAPLYIRAGEIVNSSDLTLSTYNKGNIIADTEAFVTTRSATISGQLVIGTATAPANIGNLYLTNSQVFGKALAILNQTESTDILTGSASGTTKFVFNSNGNLGIGTSTPAYLVDINGGSGIVGQFSGRVIGGSAVNSNEFVTLSQLTGGTGQYWQLNSNALSPSNSSYDVLVGATATASALIKLGGTTNATSFFNTGGNVGIGTTAVAQARLAVQSATSNGAITNGLEIFQTGTGTGTGARLGLGYGTGTGNQAGIQGYYDGTGAALGFFSSGSTTDKMTLSSSGNLGIGTTTPFGRLNVVGTSASPIGKAALAIIQNETNGDLFTASAGATTRFVINNAGNVGIGTSLPASLLHVRGTVPTITLSDPSIGNTSSIKQDVSGNLTITSNPGTGNIYLDGWHFNGGDINGYGTSTLTFGNTNGANGTLTFRNANTSYSLTSIFKGGSNANADLTQWQNSAGTVLANVTANGNLGIGTSTPASKLDIRSTTTGNALATLVQNTSGADIFTASAGATTRFVIKNDGNVGIGTSNPGVALAVNGSVLSGPNTGIGDYLFYGFNSPISGAGAIVTGGAYPLALGTGSVERLRIDTSGNVGIGTTTPFGKLNVVGSATAPIGKAALAIIQNETNGDLFTASAGATTRFVIKNDGNVGIGTSLPAYLFDVSGGSGIVGQFSGRVIGGDAVNSNEFATLGQIAGGAGQYWQLNSNALSPSNSTYDVLVGATATASALVKLGGTTNASSFFNTGGNVGIGTSAPGVAFDVLGTQSRFRNATNPLLEVYETGSGGNRRIALQVDTTNSLSVINSTYGSVGAYPLSFQIGGSDKLRIDANGNVGIGTTATTSKLQINGSTAIGYSTSTAAPTNGLAVAGNVGIGTTTTSAVLHAAISNSAAPVALFERTTASTGSFGINFNSGLSNLESVNAIRFTTGATAGTGGTERMRIDTTGNVGIGSTTPGSLFDLSGGVGRQNGYTFAAAGEDSLIVNGDFEQGSYGWTSTVPANTTTVTGGYSGNNALQITGSASLNSNDYIAVDPVNDVIQLEAYLKKSTAGGTPGVMYFGYYAYNASKVLITTSPCGTYCYFAASGAVIPADGNWHKYSATTTGEGASYPNFPVGTKYIRILGLINYSASSDSVTQIDHISLRRINNGPLFVGNNFSSTNLVDQTQMTKLYTTATNQFIITPPSSGNVGIRTTTTPATLSVNGTGYYSGNVGIGTTTLSGASLSVIGGSVGIGTTAPAASLEVSKASTYSSEGTAGISILGGTTDTKLILGADAANDVSYIQSMQQGTSYSNRVLALQPNGGYVGIGTTATTSKLQVNGSTAIGYSTSTAAPTNGLAVSGNVGIGTTTASRALTVTGDILGTQTAYIANGQQTYYAETYSVPTATNTNINLTAGNSTLSSGMQYRVVLSTTGTSTNTGAVYIVYQTAVGTWTSRLVSANGNTSNHPLLGVSGTNVYVYHNHASTYNIRAQVYGLDSGNATNTATTYFGLEGELTNLIGNIGVGTTAPAYKFDVVGGAGVVGQFSGRVIGGNAVNSNEFATLGQITGGLGNLWQLNAGSLSPSNSTYDVLVGANATASALIKLGGTANASSFFNTGGNVGIGTTGSVEKLQVAGNIRLPSSDNYIAFGSSAMRIQASNSGGNLDFAGGTQTNAFRFWSNNMASVLAVINDNGNVGIGTTTVNSKLEVKGSTTGNALVTFNNTTSNGDLFTASSSGTTKFIIANNGNTTISSTGGAGANALVLNTSNQTNSNSAIRWTGSAGTAQAGIGTYFNAADVGNLEFLNGSTTNMLLTSTGNLGIGTTDVGSKLQVNGGAAIGYSTSTAAPANGLAVSGNVGIGTTTVSAKLHSLATTEQLRLGYDASNYASFTVGSNSSLSISTSTGTGDITINPNGNLNLGTAGTDALFLGRTDANIPVVFNTLGGEAMRFTNGNLGIGTTAPTNRIQVSGSTTGNALVGLNQTTAGADILTGSASGTTKFVFNSNGNLGIGSSLPAYALDVNAGSGIVGQFSGRVIGGSAVNSNEFITLSQLTSATYWQRLLGALSPANITDDLLLGGTSTASAKFAFINNIGSGSPTATISGNLSLVVPTGSAPANTFNLLNGGSLNFQSALTGQGDAALTSRLFIKNDGNIGIGVTSPSSALAVNGVNSEIRAGITTSTGQFGVIGVTRRANYGDIMFSRNLEGVSGSDNYQTIGTLASTGYNGIEFKYGGDTYFYSQDGNTTAATTVSPVSRLTIKGDTGNVGIGTTTPFGKLNVVGAAATPIGKSALVVIQNETSQDLFTASAGATTRFVIKNDGNVGIGTSLPTAKLEIVGTSGTNLLNLIGGAGGAAESAYLSVQSRARFGYNGSGILIDDGNTSKTFKITLGGGDRLYIHPLTGNVGIGTTNPIGKLNVVGESAYATGKAALVIIQNETSGDIFTASAGATTRFVINNAGNVGIGTSLPSGTLDITSGSDTYAKINTSSSGSQSVLGLYNQNNRKWLIYNQPANHDLYFANSSTQVMTLQQSSGNVGIGTTTPTAKLDVAGDASTSGSLVFNGSNKSVDVLNGSSLSFATSVGGDAGLATKLTLLNNGNFGIGSTSPAYLFDVSGGSGIVGQFSGRVIGADAVNSNEFATLGQVSSATYWQRALGALAPENITDDVLVGGSATASAKIRLGGTTNADSFFNTGGNVGIGNSAPGTKLHVTGTITATTNVYSPQFNYDGGVTFMNGTSGALNITNVINGAIIFRTTNTERARIDGTGNLGIGTTTPFGRLNVVGESANPIGKAALVIIQNETNGDLFTASAGATTRFVIKNDGNVGIGTSLPTSDLHIYGRSADTQTVSKIEHNSGSAGQAVLSLGSTGSGGRTYTITSADAGYANGNGLLFEQGDGLSVKFMNTGNVGIGTTAPTAKLDVAGDASTSGSLVFNGSNKSVDVLNGSSLSFATSVGGDAGLATKLTLLNNGNFGIGSTAPAYLFDVSGGSGIVGQFSGRVIGGDAVNSNEFATLGQVSSSAYWQRALGALSPTNITDDVLLGATATASALVKLGGTTNATSYFNTGGNVGIGTTNPSLFKLQVTGDIGPTTNNTYDLGSSGSIWNDLYVQTARPNAILANGATGSDSIYELAGGNILLDNAKGLRFKDSGGTGFSALSVTGANNVQLNTPAASGSLQFSVANSSGIIQFLTNGSERARFDNNGNLGIGTTSPLGRLNVVGTSAAPIGKAALAIIQNETSQDLFTASAGATTRFVIKNDGNVGIGSTAPAQMLDVTGSALFSGNVGIGTTTVSDKLNINGNIRFTNATSNTIFYGTAGVAAPGAASAGQKIQLYGTAGTVGAGDYALGIESGNLWMNSGGGFKWYASSTEKMRMDANGNLGIGTTTTSPAKLSVAGHVSIEGTTKESFSGQETRTYRNLAQFRIDSPTQTGTVKIALPTAKNNSLTMMTVRITGYSYIDNGGAWEAIVSGYNYSSGWINTSAEIRGSAPFTSVRMGTDGTADVILLGTTASVWEYPQIFINEVNVGYTSEDGFEGPWTITMITDETGITVEKTPLIKMYAATNGNIGIGTVTPGSKLDIDTGSNALGLRLRGTAETVEIADMYVAASGALTLSTVAGSGTSGYIDLRGEDDQYGLILRDSAGVTPTTYANFYMNDAATDYLNITANATNATAGLIVQTGGNIGIGSTAPTQRLDTIGGFKLGNNSGTGQIDTTDWDISTTGALTGISGITTDGGYTQSGSTGNVFTGNVGVGTGATSTLGTLTLTGGDTGAGFTDAAIAFGYANTTNYAHFIHTRHNAGASASNAIDFYTSDGTAAGVYPTNAVHGLSINGGNVGVGSTNPGYKFDVQGGSGIVGNFSGRVIGASAVNSNEFITLSQLTSATYWQRLLGALSPTNITDDVLVGGTATASALIKLPGQNNQDAFFNLGTGNVGIGTTTTTDKLTVNGNANLLTGFGYEINGASVLSATTLGTGVLTSSLTTVGALNAGSITSGFGTIDTGADAITTSGTIGTAATTTFTGATGTFATSVTTPVVDNAAGLSIGATSATSLTLGRSGVTTTFGSTAWTATPTISGLITATSGLTANGALTANAAFTLGDNGDLGSVNTSSWDISTAGAFTGVTTLNMSGQLTSSLSTGTAPFVVASTTKVTNLNADLLDGIDSTGFCQTDGTGCSSAQFWQRNLGALSPKNITDDVLLGATATASATVRFGAITNANSYINTGGNLGIGTTTPGQKLDVNGSILAGANSTFDVRAAGTLAIGTATQTGITVGRTGAATTINGNASSAIDFGNFDVNATGEITAATNETINGIDISAGAISDVTTFASTYLTTTTNTVNLSGASTILQMNGTTVIDASRNLLNIGTTQFNTVTYTWPGANGAAGTVLTNNGSGTLSWSAAASGSLWTITNGIIHPNNSTLDLAIGGTATTSAAFSFINSNSTSNATPPTFRGYDATRTNYVSLNHDGTNANLSASTGTINIGAGGGTLYVTTDIINDTTSNSNGFVKIADKLLVQGTENSSTGFGNALAVIDNLGTGDILTGSASGTPKFVFNNSGNLGIGTTRPASALAVGSTSQFAVTSAGAISAATGITSSGAITFSAFTSNGGVLYTNGSGVVSQVTAGTGAQCLLGGTTPSFGTCGATAWNAIGNPSGNLSLTMGTNLTTFNWATGTSTNNLFNLTTDASSNGTGALMNIATGMSSTVLPLQVKAGSINSILVNAAGNVGIGTTTPFGKLNINNSAQASLNPLGKALAIFQQYETNGDILAASASGTTVFKLANDGTITASALYDINDTSFYVDPANATLSLSTAGNLLANAGSVISPYGGFGRYENYLTNSETLGSWTASGVTVTSDAVAGPDGQTTADQITDAVGAGTTLTQTYTAAITTGSAWTFSVWLKNNTATGTVIIKVADSTGATQSLSIDPTTITSWKRYSVTMTAGTSPTSVTATIDANQSNSTRNLYAWGAQLEKQSNSGVYATTSSTNITTTGRGLIAESAGPHLFLSGNVGLGTTTAGQLLTLAGNQKIVSTNDASIGIAKTGGNGAGLIAVNGSQLGINFDSNGKFVIGQSSRGNIDANTYSGTDLVTVLANGNVGIGTTTIGAKLHIVGVANSSSTPASWAQNIILDTTSGTNNVTEFRVAGTRKGSIRIDSSGNAVFQGASTGGTYLAWDEGSGGVHFGNGSATEIGSISNAGALVMSGTGTFGTNALISGSGVSYFNGGNVGIGTTTSGTYKLTVNGGIQSLDYGAAGTANIIVGDDAFLTDLDTANTMALYGVSNNTIGILQLGSNSGAAITGNAGNIGIGTTTMNRRFVALGSTNGGTPHSIINADTTDSTGTGVILLGTGTSTSGTNSRFIKFYAGITSDSSFASGGTGVGRVRLNGTGVAYETGAADFAEYLDMGEDAENGDIIAITTNKGMRAVKGNGLVGVVSDTAGFVGNAKSEEPTANQRIVGLLGQISTKVSNVNGPISRGDVITSSDIPGVGQRATGAGYVIGKALEDFNPQSSEIIACPAGTEQGVVCGKIRLYVSPSWYDPEVFITDAGVLNISGTNGTYTATNNGTLVSRIGSFAQAVIATLRVGALNAREITTNSLALTTSNMTIAGQSLNDYIIAVVTNAGLGGNSNSPEIKTNLISPLSGDELALDANVKIKAKDAAKPALSVEGNASISGELKAKSLETDDATVSGTLRAGRIIADDIEGLNARIARLDVAEARLASLSANNITATSAAITNITNVTNVYNTASESATPGSDASGSATLQNMIPSLTADFIQTQYADIASLSAGIGFVPNLSSDFMTVNQGLVALGPTSLSDTAIAGQLSVNGSLILAENSVNVLGANFEIQPLRQGGVSFLSGLITFDTDGNVRVSGNADFQQNVTVGGTLATSFISPLPGNDLNIILPAGTNGQGSKLAVRNASGSAVFQLNQLGDVIASGAGTFKDIAANSFNIVRGAQADTSTIETVASGSAGTAVIKAYQTERTIISPFVSEKSLIYITATSDTQGVTPYVARQIAHIEGETEGSFTIEIPSSVTTDIKINWWIVN